jgi:hypothetical protein
MPELKKKLGEVAVGPAPPPNVPPLRTTAKTLGRNQRSGKHQPARLMGW